MNSMRMGYTVLPPLMRASSSAPTPKAATEAKLLPRRAEHTVKSPRGSKMTAPANTLPRTGTQNSREISSTVCPRLPGKTYLYQALNYTFTTSIAIYKTTNKWFVIMLIKLTVDCRKQFFKTLNCFFRESKRPYSNLNRVKMCTRINHCGTTFFWT